MSYNVVEEAAPRWKITPLETCVFSWATWRLGRREASNDRVSIDDHPSTNRGQPTAATQSSYPWPEVSSRPSCSTCSLKGATCDSLLPECSSCRTTGASCSYAVSIGWTNSTTTDQLELVPVLRNPDDASRISSILRPLSLMPDATPFELQSLGHFVQGTSPTLIALEIPHENPNYIYIPLALTSSSKALYHALVASGSAHALNWGLEVSPKDVKRSERMTLSLLEKDMVEVATWLKDGRVDEARLREKVNSLLAVLQTLILYGTTAGDTKLWRKHMQGASSLLAQVAQYEAAQNPLVLNTFLLETIKFLDIQTALSLNCRTTVQYCGVETGWSPNHTVIHPSITGMNGFSGEYLTIVGRICDLSSDLSQPDPTLSPPLSTSTQPPKRSLADIRRAIDSIFSDLESCRARISALEHDPVFRTALLRRLSLGNHASKLDGHFKFADTIYYASHVYLARTLTSAYRLKEESMRFVYEGLDALAMVPWEGSAGNLLGWALVVIGSEIEDDEPARGIVRLRLKALGALGHLNLTQTSVLVEEVWRQKDERNRRGGTQLITWQNVMKGMGWDLLVV